MPPGRVAPERVGGEHRLANALGARRLHSAAASAEPRPEHGVSAEADAADDEHSLAAEDPAESFAEEVEVVLANEMEDARARPCDDRLAFAALEYERRSRHDREFSAAIGYAARTRRLRCSQTAWWRAQAV